MRGRSEAGLRQLAGGEPASSGLPNFIENRSDGYARSEEKAAELHDKIEELKKLLATDPGFVIKMITKHLFLDGASLLADLAEKLFLADLSTTASLTSLLASFEKTRDKSPGSLYDFAERSLDLDPKRRSALLTAFEPLFAGDLKDWIDCISGIKDLERILSTMVSRKRQQELLEMVFTNPTLVVKFVDFNEASGECGLMVRGEKPSMEELAKCTDSQYVITPVACCYYYKPLHELQDVPLNMPTLQTLQISFPSDQHILLNQQLKDFQSITKHKRPEYKTPLVEIDAIGALFPAYKDRIAEVYLESMAKSISSFEDLEACLRIKPTFTKTLLDGLLTHVDRVKEIMESEDDPLGTAEKIRIGRFNPQYRGPDPQYNEKFEEVYQTVLSSSLGP